MPTVLQRRRTLLSGGALAATGAMLLLAGESQGAAIDFTSSLGQVAVKDIATPANNKSNAAASTFLTQSSASAKWVRDATGVYVEKAAGVLPFEYWEGAWSLLIEPASTNLHLRNSEIDNASWTKTDTTITADNTAAPNGATAADLCTEGSAGTALIQQAFTIAGGSTNTYSIFLKRGNTDWVRVIYFHVATPTNSIAAWFNLALGIVALPTNGGVATGAVANIEPAANGFYRCIITGAVNAAATAVAGRVNSAASAGSATRVSGATYYAWGSQPEAGSAATSPIPTTTGTVTRAADAINFALSTIPWSATVNTIIAKVKPLTVNNATAGRIFGAHDTTANESFGVIAETADAPDGIGAFMTDGGAAQVAAGTTKVGSFRNADIHVGLGIEVNNIALVVDGAVITDVAATLPTVTTFDIGYSGVVATRVMHGRYKSLIILPRRGTNGELQTLAGPIHEQLTIATTQNVPDGLGGDVGEGFTCTGLAYDPIDNNWWVGNDGRNVVADVTYQPSLVNLSLNGASKVAELDMLVPYASMQTLQGVAYDTTDNTLWIASTDEGKVHHVSQAGADLAGDLTITSVNGLAYDSLRDQLWYVKSTGPVYRIAKNSATQLAQITLPFDWAEVDNLFYDAARDWLWVSYGTAGANGWVAAFNITTGLMEYHAELLSVLAIEGIALRGSTLYVTDDEYAHGVGISKNRLITVTPSGI